MDQKSGNSFSAPAYARLREQIRADIVSGAWRMGQHVTMAQLAARYGVSGNPVREALHQLQGDGLVEIRLNRGAVIRTVDASFIKNVYDVRGAIEGMLAAEAASNADQEDLDRIAARVAAYEKAVGAGDIAGIVQANRDLHQEINKIARNPLALEIFDGRSSLIDALRRNLGTRPGRLDEVIGEHRAIYEAIAGRNVEEARVLAQRHTARARDHMLDMLASQPAG